MRGGIPDPVEPLGARSCAGLRSDGLAGRSLALLGIALSAGLLAGCGSLWGKKEIVENNDPPDVIYGKAEALVSKGKFNDAARIYEEVDINYPYSPEARRAILMAAYAYYKGGKYDDAIGAADEQAAAT